MHCRTATAATTGPVVVPTTTRRVATAIAATAAEAEAMAAASHAITTRTSTVATVRTRPTRANNSRVTALSQTLPRTGRTAPQATTSRRHSSRILVAGNRWVSRGLSFEQVADFDFFFAVWTGRIRLTSGSDAAELPARWWLWRLPTKPIIRKLQHCPEVE